LGVLYNLHAFAESTCDTTLKALQKEEKRIADSIIAEKNKVKDSIISEKYRREKQKKDSLNAEYDKLLHAKLLWIKEIFAYEYGNQSTGIVIKFINTSKKTIKYLNFTACPYNRVDDPVIDNMGKSSKSCKLIGPIGPDEEATYNEDIFFFSNVVEYYKLKNISVQYMDNTVQYFNYKDILLK